MTVYYPLGQALPEYADAKTYDRDNTWSADDEFYLALAGEIGGPVLDAACGTGRLARAMAESGLEVTGLDVTPEMLERARTLSSGLNVTWVLDDVRTMQIGHRFRLITMTGHAFQHLLTDDEITAFLARVKEHLLDGGRLAFETRNYAAKRWGKSAGPEPWGSFQDEQGHQVDETLVASYDQDTGIEEITFVQVTRDTGERAESTTVLRYLDVEHLNRLLNENGFTVEDQYGDWRKSPLGESQPEIISICRLHE